ncbi:MAG TPA: hypothetical protein VFT69_17035 [Pseudolabrys sp.]|nr:hypothetical protein [Pseudolabrys sp.]
MEATLPNALWETPSLRGKIEVSDPGSAAMSFELEAAADAVKKAVGLDIDLRVVDQMEGE